jgi:hypothetical protein
MGARKSSLLLTVRVGGPEGHIVKVNGREAWALENLMRAGEAGCTPITTPGPRWSAYIHDLRGAGITIETLHEPHGPPFIGTHAKYVLRSHCEVVERTEGGRSAPGQPQGARSLADILSAGGAA